MRKALAEKRKASVRAKVEHPFLKVKRVFGYAKVRYRGLAKNTERLALLFGLGNLLTAEGQLTRLTWAQWAQIQPGGYRKGRSKPAMAPSERNGRVEHSGNRLRKLEYFHETPPATVRKTLAVLVQSIPREQGRRQVGRPAGEGAENAGPRRIEMQPRTPGEELPGVRAAHDREDQTGNGRGLHQLQRVARLQAHRAHAAGHDAAEAGPPRTAGVPGQTGVNTPGSGFKALRQGGR